MPSTPPPAPPVPAYRAPALPPSSGSDIQSRRDLAQDGYGSTRYRTVCVRTCDGYYFPISFTTTRQGFSKDANSCRAACGQDAQLFFQPNKTSDANELIDMSGRSYNNLPNAFKYRKKLVEGCKCKPDPWAQSELDRHKRYEMAEEATKQRAQLAEQQAQDPAGTPDGSAHPDKVAATEPTSGDASPTDAATTDVVATKGAADSANGVGTSPQRNAEGGTDQPWVTRSRPIARASVARPVKVQGEGFFGLGASSKSGFSQKYRWPGD